MVEIWLANIIIKYLECVDLTGPGYETLKNEKTPAESRGNLKPTQIKILYKLLFLYQI